MSTVTYTPPVIPSKYDIIPIHNSDRASFKRCRRYWDWSSPAKQNLMVRADVYGVNTNLWFGTGIHYALEEFYRPGFRRDPVEAWKTWFDVQWRGGVVTADWLDLVYDLKPTPVRGKEQNGLPWIGDGTMTVTDTTLYQVKGLVDILPDPNTEEFDALFELGIGMMEFYKSYAAKNDGFEVVAVEHTFSIPVWDYENDCILKALDTREQSPNYGKMLEVHARGRMDDIIQKPTGKLGIMDHKTAKSIAEDYFEKLETDQQCLSYLYAAQIEADYYDLPHKGEQFEDLLYNVLRKAAPRPPSELASGMFSINRADESTTIELLEAWIEKNLPGVPLNEKQVAYVNYVRERGDEQFIIRKSVRRNQHEIASAGYELYLEAMDMLDNPRIYKNMSNDYLCQKCQFRVPCIAKDSGADWQSLIKDNYSVNKDR